MMSSAQIEKAIKSGDVTGLTKAAQELLRLQRRHFRLTQAADDVATAIMQKGLCSLADDGESRHWVASKITALLHTITDDEAPTVDKPLT